MQDVFKRWEKKFLITETQAETLLSAVSKHMRFDAFDTYWVQNIYFDTPHWDVIQTSMQKPYYKEKMRLRYYEKTQQLYLELKKKYAGIVYKRRVALPPAASDEDLLLTLKQDSCQIARELLYYLQSTKVEKKMFISYKRHAFSGVEQKDLRLTFDREVRYRTDMFSFEQPENGTLVLANNLQLMEIKTATSVPLWLTKICSEQGIFASSYSKYAACYLDHLQKTNTEKLVHTHV